MIGPIWMGPGPDPMQEYYERETGMTLPHGTGASAMAMANAMGIRQRQDGSLIEAPKTTPDIGRWLIDLRNALHLYKGRDITQRDMEKRLSTLGDNIEGYLRSQCAHRWVTISASPESFEQCEKCGEVSIP